MKKVAINGLGRIGRLVLRHLMKVPHVQVVAVNDLTDAPTLAHLMKYDSVHGQADFPVASDGDFLVLDGRRIRVYAEKDPRLIPFGALGAQVVLECTGKFTKRAQAALHLQGWLGTARSSVLVRHTPTRVRVARITATRTAPAARGLAQEGWSARERNRLSSPATRATTTSAAAGATLYR